MELNSDVEEDSRLRSTTPDWIPFLVELKKNKKWYWGLKLQALKRVGPPSIY